MIIFLDIDGCLATHSSYIHRDYPDAPPRRRPGLHKPAVAVLEAFFQRGKDHIVISSAWRIYGLRGVRKTLRELGLKLPIMDITRNPVGIDHDPSLRGKGRGNEILDWIKENHYDGDYLVIDDEIFDIRGTIPEEKICYVENGWLHEGLTAKHLEPFKRPRIGKKK